MSLGLLHDRLYGGLWHTTHPRRFLSILASGALKVDPPLPDTERWKAAAPDLYPFVRVLGGISLFDFADFDQDFVESNSWSSWDVFVPHRRLWGVAVWIEIKRSDVAGSFLSTRKLLNLWDQPGNHRHSIMPWLEAAHIGNLPMSAVASAFITWGRGEKIHEIDLCADDIAADPVLQHFGNAVSDRPAPLKRKSPPQRPSLKLATFLHDGQLAWTVAQDRGISEAVFYSRLKLGMTPDEAVYTPVIPPGRRYHCR